MIILVLSIITSVLFMLNYSHFKHHIRFKTWSQKLQLQKHERTYHRLFKHVDGFALSRKARLKHDAIEYMYGEIDFLGFITLLSLVNPNQETVFYDLGSGVGKAIIACAMVFDVQKSCGIEFFNNLHHCAIKQKKSLEKLKAYQEKASRIRCIEGDFMTTDFDEATLIFVNATGFVSPLWNNLSMRIAESNCHTVISTSKPVASSMFTVTHKLQIPMSWGFATVFIQQRLTL